MKNKKENTEIYLREVLAQIRCRKAHDAVREELYAHIEDQKEAFLREGMTEDEAEAMAVREMGDPVTAGTELDRIHRPRMIWGMIGLIAALSLLGFVCQCLIYQHSLNTVPPWEKAVFMLGGFLLMIAVCYVDYSRIGFWAKEIYIFSFLILLVYTSRFGIGPVLNGRRNWINFGPYIVNIQTLLLLAAPLYGAILYSFRGRGFDGLFRALLWMMPPLFITLRIPSFMTMAMLLLAMLIMLTVALARGWFRVPKKAVITVLWAVCLVSPMMLLVYESALGNNYRSMRLQSILGNIMEFFGAKSPFEVLPAMSEQQHYVKNILEQSKMIGGNGAVQDSFEFFGRNTYMLTYVIGFYGILAAVLLMAAIVFLIMRLFRNSFRQKNQLGMIMGTGCASVFFFRIVLYVLNNLGFLGSDLDCPFLTMGGTTIVVSYILIGLLLSICRYQNVLPVNSPVRKAVIRRIKI